MADIVQYKSGSIDNAASATITFDNATDAGNTIFIIGGSGINAPTGVVGFTTPTGGAGSFSEQPFTGSGSSTSRVLIQAWAQKNVAAGETSYTLPANTLLNTGCWIAVEVTGLWDGSFSNGVASSTLEPPYYSTTSKDASDATGEVSSITSPNVPSDLDTLQSTRFYLSLGISAFLANEPSSTQPVISGYSTGQNELTQVSMTATAGHSLTLAVTYRKHYDLGRFNASANVSPTSYFTANELIWADATSKHAPIFDVMTGFEMGTTSGLTSVSTAVAGTGPFDSSAGSPEIVSTFKRTGNYALKLSSTSAAEWVAWTDTGVLSVWQPNVANPATCAITALDHFYFDTSLPGSDVELFSVEAGSTSNSVTIWYRSSSQKIGVKVGTGTEQLSDATISADKWVQINMRYYSRSTTHTCDWQIRYDSLDSATSPVSQTQASATGMTDSMPSAVVIGSKSARTVTVYHDDVFVCKQLGPYPLGDRRISPVLPDQTGTPTISGTTANFQTYSSNGTGTAWNATTARSSIDDMPPTVGASADGIMQITAASSDYVDIPMDTLNLGQTMSPKAIRWYVPIWAASGTAATLGIKAVDGSNTLFDSTVADHGQDSSATLWICGMHRLSNNGLIARLWQLTKTRLDALSLRFGFSTDANPDVGIHAVLAEVAWAPPVEFVVSDSYDSLNGVHRAILRQDPTSGSALGFLVSTPNNGKGATFSWNVDGTDNNHYVATNSTWTVDLNLDGVGNLLSYGLIPD